MHLRAAIVEADATLRVVMRDDEEGMQMRKRALIDALDQALRRAEQPAAGDEEHGQQRRQSGRQHAFLQDHRAVEIGGVGKLDLARDAGADGIALEFRGQANADAVHPLLAAKGKGDDVAIGGEVLAEPVGKAEAALARSEQDLGRAERAGGEHDGACASTKRGSASFASDGAK